LLVSVEKLAASGARVKGRISGAEAEKITTA